MINGEKIKKRRLELGLSLADVAKALNVNPSTILRYETKAIRKFPTDVLPPLAKVLKCSELYLMGYTDNPEPLTIDDYNVMPIPTELKLEWGEKVAEWQMELGTINFTEEEELELLNYAKYIISRRKNEI